MRIETKIELIDKVLPVLRDRLLRCDICPRACGVNRLNGQKGYCSSGVLPMVYTCSPHRGEEPPISGTLGSGTVFFSNCNMRCVYCQNYQFSRLGRGKEISPGDLGRVMLRLQNDGCHNINLVSPTHFVPAILEALRYAYEAGLNIPVVYNTGGYDAIDVIRALDGIMDIYLPDMRYSSDYMAVKYSDAPGYVENNRIVVKEMWRQVGSLTTNDNAVAVKGLVIRLLVIPQNISGTLDTLDFIAGEISREVSLSVMCQYYPAANAKEYPGLDSKIRPEEYRKVTDRLCLLGMSNGWVQDISGNFDERFAGENFKEGIPDIL